MSAASELTNLIIGRIHKDGGYAWRAESTGIFEAKRGIMRASPKKGVADVLAVYKGCFVAVEVKIGSDRLSDEQEGFLENIRHYGGQAFVATDPDQFSKEWIAACGRIDEMLR